MPAFRRFRHVALVTGVLLATLLPASPVRAASIVVTTTTDEYGTGPGECSLREAVYAANNDAAFGGCPPGFGADVITLPAGIYGFARSGAESFVARDVSIGDLDVFGTLTIVGQGDPTIDGNGLDRLFELASGDSLTLRGLSLTDGKTNAGGAIKTESATLSLDDVVIGGNSAASTAVGSSAYAGAIWAGNSTVSIAGSSIVQNGVSTVAAADVANGGGIVLSNTNLTITDSVIAGNIAQDVGGGLLTDSGGVLTLTNTTISGNQATDGDGAMILRPTSALLTNVTIAFNGVGVGGKGGGLYAYLPDAMKGITLENVTFSNNLGGASGGTGGNIYIDPASLGNVTAKNTIAAHPMSGGNCGGKALTYTNGYNLEFVPGGTASPCFGASDPTTVFGDPKFPLDAVTNVAPPADNGGPTKTLALGAGSAAADAGITAFGVTKDQRGVPRPYGSAPDIGAYERAFCQNVLVSIVGTAGNDNLTGTAAADGILGLDGDDVINGLGANDGLCGNGGNDLLNGGDGNDGLDGGGNNDTLVPGTGLDRVLGGAGIDTVSYAASNSAVSVDLRLATGFANGQGRDTINGVENVIGSRFADTVRGSNLANLLRLGGGADRAYGYGGADRIEGGPGRDSLFGGKGNDALYGEAGNDTFNGEAGRDLCRQGPGVGRRISCERR